MFPNVDGLDLNRFLLNRVLLEQYKLVVQQRDEFYTDLELRKENTTPRYEIHQFLSNLECSHCLAR